MKSRETRTTTQPGLGKVDGAARRTAVRERLSAGALDRQRKHSDAPASAPPISVPPLSGAPLSARHTRAIEAVPISERVPASVEPELMPDDEPPSTKPADTKALAQADRPPRERRPTTIREEASDDEVVEVRRPNNQAGDGVQRKLTDPSQRRAVLRPIEGRPVGSSRAPEPKPLSSKPPRRPLTSRPPAPARPASIPPPRSVRPAKSARASIRTDDVGAAVKSGADALRVSGRQVPKIVRTKDEIAEAPIDHRAGFLLAHIDGVTTVQGLVDIAGMPENELHEILDRLRRLGIVTIR